jgi:hypothetical protein
MNAEQILSLDKIGRVPHYWNTFCLNFIVYQQDIELGYKSDFFKKSDFFDIKKYLR